MGNISGGFYVVRGWILRGIVASITRFAGLALWAGVAAGQPHAAPSVAALYGDWFEGAFPVAQLRIEAGEYRGFSMPQAFRPFYIERRVPMRDLPVQVQCCIVHPLQHPVDERGNPYALIIDVYVDPNPADGRPARGNFIGPVDSFIVLGPREIVSIAAPYIGRRAHR